MAGYLVDCPEHKFVFKRIGDAGQGVFDLRITASWDECPKCGRPAAIVDGTYRDAPGVGESATLRLTAAQLRRLNTVLEHTKRETLTTDPDRAARDLERALRRDAPVAAKVLDSMSSKHALGLAAWLSVLLAVISFIISLQDTGMTEERLVEIIASTLEEAQSHSPETPSESPKSTRAQPSDEDPPEAP